MAPLVIDEITVVGSRCGPFAPALRLLEQRLIAVDTLLDAEYPLVQGVEAFRRAMIPGTLKVQIVMGVLALLPTRPLQKPSQRAQTRCCTP
jgi:threonine dehydrogenase-like Zn-dependent dehydrogenase